MRILFASANEYVEWGGSEELWAQAAARLADRFEVVASVKRWPRVPAPVARLQAAGVRVLRRAPDRFPMRIARRLLRLREDHLVRHLRAIAPAFLVVSQGGNYDGIGWMLAARSLGIPYAVIVQANAEIWWPADAERERWLAAYLGATRVFFVAERNAELLEDQLGMALTNRTTVWNPWKLPSDQALPWPSEDRGLQLACVARLDAIPKGHDALLRAWAMGQWKRRGMSLHFYGDGQQRAGLQALARHLDLGEAVSFHGHVEDVAGIWRHSHALVMASRWEGTSLALLESMGAGRPAIVTDVGGAGEVCVDEVTGFIAPAPVVRVLHQTLERAWDRREAWRAMGIAARARLEAIAPRDPIGSFCEQLLATLPKAASA